MVYLSKKVLLSSVFARYVILGRLHIYFNSCFMSIKILSKRYFQDAFYWQQVFEWENVLKEKMSAKLHPNLSLAPFAKIKCLFNCLPICPNNPSIIFDMNPERRWIDSYNRKNVIPYVIDFYLDTNEKLEKFYRDYKNHKYVLVSSIEAVNYLKEKKCPLNIVHAPLTMSDKYYINEKTVFDKEIDLLLMGRQNKVMQSYLDKYLSTHDINVVKCKKENGHFNYYDKKGNYYGNADKRDGVMELLRKSRISLYTEKGLEGDIHHGAHSDLFIHVTPRLFEYIVTGNHVIASYAHNSESEFFELEKMFVNVQSYDDFEREMNKAMSTPVDMKKYSDYMKKHYTSTLVPLIKHLIDTL